MKDAFCDLREKRGGRRGVLFVGDERRAWSDGWPERFCEMPTMGHSSQELLKCHSERPAGAKNLYVSYL